MSWKYDVYLCTKKNALSHGFYCDEHMEHAGSFYDYGYRDAYKLAHELGERDGHATVEVTSPHNGNTALRYQHTRGGGLCSDCGRHSGNRGPWTSTPIDNRFMCERCAAQRRREWGKAAGWPDGDCTWYRSVIENANR